MLSTRIQGAVSHANPVFGQKTASSAKLAAEPALTAGIPTEAPSAMELPRFSGARYVPGKGMVPDYSIPVTESSVRNKFTREFKRAPQGLYYAPGRFCVFSSHTDYNGGHVLAAGHTKGTFAAAARRTDRIIQVYTMNARQNNQRETVSINLDQPAGRKGNWGDFIQFTALQIEQELKKQGLPMRGANIVIGSDIDIGSGVSASAALENVIALALMDLYGKPVETTQERITLSRNSQLAEHAAGNPCGYLDQASSALAEDGKMLLMSCRNPDGPEGLKQIEINLPEDKTFLLINTNKTHQLRGSGDEESPYAKRRRVCEEALAILKELPEYASKQVLCDFKPSDLRKHKALLESRDTTPEKTMYKWALHAVTEDQRTMKGARALAKGNYEEVGRLMKQSHNSSRDLYGISCPELEVIQRFVVQQPGVYGAQVIGGGFGGNILAFIDKTKATDLKYQVKRRYQRVFPNLEPSFTETRPSAGARVLWGEEGSRPAQPKSPEANPAEKPAEPKDQPKPPAADESQPPSTLRDALDDGSWDGYL